MTSRHMVISLIGRPNVGKSSLFNALIGRQNKALTYDRPGVTRDRHYAIAKFDEDKLDQTAECILVDTGGFYPEKINEESERREESKANHFFNCMIDHAKTAVEESDVVLFVVDVREGILPIDEQIADYIRSSGKECWVVVNKFDSENQRGDEACFYSLGQGKMWVVSAAHAIGLTQLKEDLQSKILSFAIENEDLSQLQKGLTPREEVVARMAIIGAPNAGKSTLLNQLLGADRALVSNIAGTTIDPIEGFFDLYFGPEVEKLTIEKDNYHNHKIIEEYESFRKNNPSYQRYLRENDLLSQKEIIANSDEVNDEVDELNDDEIQERVFQQVFDESDSADSDSIIEEKGSFWRSINIIDTAGIRRKSHINDAVEAQSVFRSLKCITQSDIVIQVVDATKGITHQDRRLVDVALEKGKSIIIVLNKIDLMKDKLKTEKDKMEWIKDLRINIPWLDFCDVVTLSALQGRGIKGLKRALIKTVFIRHRKVGTSDLNKVVHGLVEQNPVVVKKSGGKRLKIKYASMIKSSPPTFILFSNKSKGIPENYKRYLKNGLRRNFEFDNTPLHLIFRTTTELENRNKSSTTN